MSSPADRRATALMKRDAVERVDPMYALPAHVSFCIVPGGAIFLDLRQDKYFAIDQAHTATLSNIVHGWPPSSNAEETGDESTRYRAEQIAQTLVERGLLIEYSGASEIATSASLPSVDASLLGSAVAIQTGLNVADIARFLRAALQVYSSMRLHTLEYIARRLSARKQRFTAGHLAMEVNLHNVVSKYNFLRALSFTARRACLFDSLVMIEFLSHYRIYPTWVIGVRTGPFGAHSWVQYERYVLNGTVPFVRTFTPILTV